jgi:hypothetical protein
LVSALKYFLTRRAVDIAVTGEYPSIKSLVEAKTGNINAVLFAVFE